MFYVIKRKTEAASAYPSNVDVPRPNSSNTANDFLVAYFRIYFVSSISTKKVLLFSKILSEAPIRVKILSNMVILQLQAGTKHPSWASIIIRAVCLKIVDLPPMFGPVTSRVVGS